MHITQFIPQTSLLGAAVAALLALPACSKGNPGHDAAVQLRAGIDSLMAAGQFDDALALIDTLNTRHPLEIDLRRDLVGVAAQAREQRAMAAIPGLDTEIARLQYERDSLTAGFALVQPSKALPGYLVAASEAKTDFAARAGLQARVNTGQDASDTPWTLAANAGRDIGLASVAVATASGASFTMNAHAGTGDMASLSPESADPLGRYLHENPSDKAVSVAFAGTKGKSEARLTPAQSDAIAAAWQLAQVQAALRSCLIDREKQERILQIARDQKVNAQPASAPSAS